VIPAALLTRVPPPPIPTPPPAPMPDRSDLGTLPPVPMLLWPRGYTEGPCETELGVERLHRPDGSCTRCSTAA